jgi:hypothetical protein
MNFRKNSGKVAKTQLTLLLIGDFGSPCWNFASSKLKKLYELAQKSQPPMPPDV